jgi:transcriptional antiterminator RfaH
MQQWFVIHTHAKSEHKAEFHLRRQGFDTYLPCYLKRRSHARRIEMVRSPLFPRYLFVRMDIKRDRWRPIISSVGVSSLVCFGDNPAAVPNKFIDTILQQEDEAGLVRLNDRIPIKPGDAVQFLSGAMENKTGIYSYKKDEDRVIVMLELLGRQIEVLTNFETITACR